MRNVAPLLVTAAAVLAVSAVVLGGVAAVPDARLTVEQVDTTTSEPTVGERVGVNVTVSNSGGSPAAANVTEVRLLGPDGDTLDVASAPGALSPGDEIDTELWARFDEPGEQRLTVEVVATEPDEDGDTVRVQRDVIVDVQSASEAVDLRTRALSEEELRADEEDDEIDVGGIDGIIGGDGGLETDESDAIEPMDAPVAVTVVNTGTVPIERVSVAAAIDDTGDVDAGDNDTGDVDAGDNDTGDVDAGDNDTGDVYAGDIDTAPFVVPDVDPGEERRVIVDLGRIDQQSNVTMTATYHLAHDGGSGGEIEDADDEDEPSDSITATERTVSTELVYPPRDGHPVVTDATVSAIDDGTVLVDASVGNAGSGEMEGVVVSVANGPGVAPTPAGGEYFVGVVGDSEFVPVELEARVNATTAQEIPLRIEYVDRGVRYTETLPVALPDNDEADDGGLALGETGSGADGLGIGGTGIVVAVIGVLGVTAAGVVLRRRDV